MYGRERPDVSVHHDPCMTAKEDIVGHRNKVLYNTVMRYVSALHQVAIVAYIGWQARVTGLLNLRKFPENVIMSNLDVPFGLNLLVLSRGTYNNM
jgi:hypothetical protein